MLQSVLLLQAASGRFDDLVDEYRRTRVIEAAVPFGLIRGEAVRIAARPDQLIVTSLWPDEAAYDSWLASDERRRVTANLPDLLDPDAPPVIRRIPRDDEADADAELPVDVPVEGPVERVLTVRS